MFSIEQSLFLRALGQAISHSLWQMAALWLAYTAFSNMGKWSANRKYILAATTGLAGFAWFVVTLVKSYYTLPPQQALAGVYADGSTEPGSSLPDYLLFIYHSTAISLRSLLPYISCAYLLLFVVLSIRLSNGFRQVKLFSTQGLEKTGVEWRLFVQQHAVALGITKKVEIFTSQFVQSPLTLGFWNPIILMPVASLAHLTTAQVESILLHELAHIRRHDYLVNIFLQIAETTLFFNPFMRLLLKQVKQERENSCDDYVLQFQYSPKDYATALLAVEQNKNPAMLALAAKGNQSFQLLTRVKRMVAPQPKAFSYRQQLGLLLLLTVLTLGFTIIIPHPKKTTAEKPGKSSVANKTTSTNTKTSPILTEKMPVDIPAPPLPPAFNMVDAAFASLTDNQDFTINEEALAASTKEIEASANEIEALGTAYGKEMEARIKPMETKWEEWGKQVAAQYEDGKIPDAKTQEAVFKQMPFSVSDFVNSDKLKKLTEKVNKLVKNLPLKAYEQLSKKAQRTATQLQQKAANEQLIEEETKDEDDSNIMDEQTYNAWKDGEAARQLAANKQKQLAAFEAQNAALRAQLTAEKAGLEKLRLGLFTDDRDTTLTGLNGLLAKLDKKHRWHRNGNTQPDVQVQTKNGKYVVTIPEIELSLDTKDWDLPVNLKLDGQNIDVRHEKQMKNGKEEKVMVISIK